MPSLNLAIDELERRPDKSAIDAFLASNTFPLSEGPFCTFAFRGEADAADTESGTSMRLSARFCAVTTTSSSITPSATLAAAGRIAPIIAVAITDFL